MLDQEHSATPKSHTIADECPLNSDREQLKAFMSRLDAGDQPGPIEIMAALSIVTAVSSDFPQTATKPDEINLPMSQNKCRFCD